MSAAPVDHEQILTATYSAAIVLIAAVTDPVALEAAPLRHRAMALNAVSTLIGRLHKIKPPARPTYTHFKWDFGEPSEEDRIFLEELDRQEKAAAQAHEPAHPAAPEPQSAASAPDYNPAQSAPGHIGSDRRPFGNSEETYPGLCLDDPIYFDPARTLSINGVRPKNAGSPYFYYREPSPESEDFPPHDHLSD